LTRDIALHPIRVMGPKNIWMEYAPMVFLNGIENPLEYVKHTVRTLYNSLNCYYKNNIITI